MKFYRAWAIAVRQLYLFPRSLDRITDAFFWPIMDVALLGLMSTWISQSQQGNNNILLSVLTCLLYWRITWAASYEISINILEECWNRNLTNICSSPLTKLEWLMGNVAVGYFKLAAIVGVQSLAVWIFFSLNVFQVGWMTIPFMASLTISGWCLGAVASGIVLRLGIRAQAVSWTLAFLLAPISAAYFPLDLLPHYLQPIALALPTTYIMEGLRALLLGNGNDWSLFVNNLLLNLVYLIASFWYLNHCFEKTRITGFDHLE